MKLHTKYQRPGPCGFRAEDFLRLSLYNSMVKQWTLGRGHFGPQGNHFQNFGRGPLDDAIYQISKTWAFWFRTRRFLKVLPI